MTSRPRLLDPENLPALQDEIRATGAQGWLLFDFRDQNPPAHGLLEVEKTTRRAFALFPVEGEPRLLRHAIEGSSWRHWPWETRSYSGREELEEALPDLLADLRTLAMEFSPGGGVPTVDRVPAGLVERIRSLGVRLVSSGDLLTRYRSTWGEEGLASHRRAARVVKETALAAFRRAGSAAGSRTPGAGLREGELMDWIRDELRRRGLSSQVDCIVAGGPAAADPHYHPVDGGNELAESTLVLIDLWGAEAGGIPADQTWMAWLGDRPDPRAVEVFDAVRGARDRALEFLRQGWKAGGGLQGWEVDRAARDHLRERGLDRWFIHRLGHSIDGELHGSGPDLDDLETREERRLLPGTGFSVEPGVYIPGELGMRSEVNVYWGPEGPEVTPEGIQEELLHPPFRSPL